MYWGSAAKKLLTSVSIVSTSSDYPKITIRHQYKSSVAKEYYRCILTRFKVARSEV